MNLKVVSTNIRFQNPADGHNDWPNRKELLAKTLHSFSPQIIGTQEGRRPQLKEFESFFEGHKIVDSHRDWIEQRMYPCLLLNTKSYDVIESGDIWLSQTPDIPGSSSFESAFPRLCCWAIIEDKKSRQRFLTANVHLDHVLDKTRQQQAQVLSQELAKKNQSNLPIILMGDFNASPTSSVRSILEKGPSSLYDPWQALGKEETSSYHKFQGSYPEGERIDWFLIDPRFKCSEVFLDTTADNNIYPSDHFPLMGNFHLKD